LLSGVLSPAPMPCRHARALVMCGTTIRTIALCPLARCDAMGLRRVRCNPPEGDVP